MPHVPKKSTTPPKPPPTAVKRVGRTLADFEQLHDKTVIIPRKIMAAITLLGSDGWEYDGPFTKLAGVSQGDMADYRDQFAQYQSIAKPTKASNSAVPKIIWCGSLAFAKRLGGPRQPDPVE